MNDQHRDDRAAYIAGLRAYADWLETNPDVPTSVVGTEYYAFDTFIGAYDFDVTATMAGIARALPGVRHKKINENHFQLLATFDGFHVRFLARRGDVCERTQVGVQVVERPDPEAPKVTVEEPVYEYRCESSLLAALDNGEAVAS